MTKIIAKRFGRYDKSSYLCNRINMLNLNLLLMRRRRITVFNEYGIIISIKINTFVLNCLVNGIIFVTFATPNPILL